MSLVPEIKRPSRCTAMDARKFLQTFVIPPEHAYGLN